MDKRKKPNVKTATKKAKGAGTPAANSKPTGRKAQAAHAENAGLPELLRELIAGVKVVADRVESVRRTLWRMSEVRNYEKSGAKPTEKSALREAVADVFTPLAEKFIADMASGRIDTAPEYAAFRDDPNWAAFRESFNAGGVKPKTEGGAE